jgi:hypothetical protein
VTIPLRVYEELIWSELAGIGAARSTMPLGAYFVIVGPTLLALLLLLTLILGPSKPAIPSPADASVVAGVLKSTARPRLTTGSAQPTAFLTAPAFEPQRLLPTTSPEPQLSRADAERKSVTRPKTAQARVRTHSMTAAGRESGYDRNAWNFSASTKHGPE